VLFLAVCLGKLGRAVVLAAHVAICEASLEMVSEALVASLVAAHKRVSSSLIYRSVSGISRDMAIDVWTALFLLEFRLVWRVQLRSIMPLWCGNDPEAYASNIFWQ
jgi:hypothetical protein